jgi:hypothetical protein
MYRLANVARRGKAEEGLYPVREPRPEAPPKIKRIFWLPHELGE